jgi:hypothetical protein
VAITPLAAVLILVLVGVTGCSSHHPGRPAPAPPSSTTLVAPSAPSATAPPASSAPSSARTAADCPAGSITLRWQPDSPPPTAICVHTGTEITVILLGRVYYQWGPLMSSDSQIVAVGVTGQDQEGAAHSTINARRPGAAVITATATSRAEPAGPAITWRQSIAVTS